MSSGVLERTVGVPLPVASPSQVAAPARRVRAAALVGLMMVIVGSWWALEHAATLRRSAVVLAGLRPGWLLLAVVAAGSTWVFSAVSQQGAVAEHLPRRQNVAVQVAGTFASQFTPAGLGGSAVNVRFLRRRGVPSAVAAVGLTQVAGVAVHLVLLGLVLAADPSPLTRVHLTGPHAPAWLPYAGFVLLVVAVLAVSAAHERVSARLTSLVEQLRDATAHLVSRRRSRQLVLGSVGLTCAHVMVLFAILHALSAPAGLLDVAAAYLLATSAAAVLPTPAGLGGLDACLGVLLYSAGVDSETALAAVLAYRLLTSWLPLLPSAVTLNVLVRRAVV